MKKTRIYSNLILDVGLMGLLLFSAGGLLSLSLISFFGAIIFLGSGVCFLVAEKIENNQ
jgi:hypothetical protein